MFSIDQLTHSMGDDLLFLGECPQELSVAWPQNGQGDLSLARRDIFNLLGIIASDQSQVSLPLTPNYPASTRRAFCAFSSTPVTSPTQQRSGTCTTNGLPGETANLHGLLVAQVHGGVLQAGGQGAGAGPRFLATL